MSLSLVLLLWTPTHGSIKASGRPPKIYIDVPKVVTGLEVKDLRNIKEDRGFLANHRSSRGLG